MKRLFQFPSPHTERDARWVWKNQGLSSEPNDSCEGPIDAVEALRMEMGGELNTLACDCETELEAQAFADVQTYLSSEAGNFTKRDFLSGRIQPSTRLNLDPKLPESVRTSVTEKINALSFSDRLALIGEETLADLIRLNDRLAIKLLSQNPDCVAELSAPIALVLMRTLALQNPVNDEATATIINRLDESDLLRFISTNAELIPRLCTRVEGNVGSIIFYDNQILEREISPVLCFPDQPYIRAAINGVTYRQTAHGFRAFYQDTWFSDDVPINEKAFASSKTNKLGYNSLQFEINCTLTDEETAALDGLTAEQELPPEAEESPDYAINQAYALNFKLLASSIGANLPAGLPTDMRDDIIKQANALKVFLDGRRLLLDGQMPPQPIYAASVIAHLPPLDYNQTPAEARAATEKALSLISKHFKQQMQTRMQVLQNPDLSEIEAVRLLSEINCLQNSLQAMGEATKDMITEMQTDAIAIRNQHQASLNNRFESYGFTKAELDEYWAQINDPELEPGDRNQTIDRVIAIAEARLRSMDTPFSEAMLQTQLDELRRELLTHVQYRDAVDQGTQLTESLRRLEAMSRYQDQYIVPALKLLQEANLPLPAELKSAFASGQFNAAHVAQLDTYIEANRTLIEVALAENGASTEDLNFFLTQSAGEHFADYMRATNDSIEVTVEAATQRRTARALQIKDVNFQLETYFNTDGTRRVDTPEAEEFWQSSDLRGDLYTEYYQTHGTLPPLEVAETIEAQVKKIAAATNQTINLKEPDEALVQQLNLSPPGGIPTQSITIRPDGSLVVVFENQNVAYQLDESGGIVGENFAGIPDNEDLITNNWPLAQFYANTCSGNVTNGLARLTAQGAERGGQASMGQSMENLMNDLFRDPNYTFSPNQTNQCEQLGQRMAEYDLNIDQVFARLGGGYSLDGTINNSQVIDGLKFIALLEASVAENREGFERILGLDSERPRQEEKATKIT